jgi:hypothetical protein
MKTRISTTHQGDEVNLASSLLEYAAVLLGSGFIGAVVVYALYHGLAVETLASLLVAAGTLYLAFWTRQSVAKTQEIVSNDDNHQRTSVTIDLIKSYMWEPIQASATLSLTPHAAVSQVRNAAKDLGKLEHLKAIFYSAQTPPNEEARNQYRAIAESIPIASNFFHFANELRQRDVLNLQLFMNSFAITLIKTYEAMLEINPIVQAAQPESLESLEEFRAISQRWVDERK